MSKQLIEQGRLSEAVGADKSIFPVTIISEGVGSSGVYRREMLQENAHAFPKGTKSFIDHPKDATKPWERSLTSIAGKLIEDAHYAEEDGVGMLKSQLKVDSRWSNFVEEYKDVIGLSIYIGAFGEEEENGKVVVEAFDTEDPYASVDIVVAAGRGGRFDQAVESFRQIENSLGHIGLEEDGSGKPAEPHTPNKEDISMEIEELAGKVDKLTEALTAYVELATPVLESLKPREDDDKVVDLELVTEALITANLAKRSRKVVLEAVRNGAVIEDAIKEAKTDEDEFRKELRVQEGIVESDNSFTGDVTDLGKVFGN